MNIKTHIYILLCLCFCYSSCIAQSTEETYTKTYDLDFTMRTDSFTLYPWMENAAYANYTLPVFIKDSTRVLFAKEYMRGFPFSDRLRTEYQQRVLLPIHHEKSGSIKFENKGENIKSVSILLDGMNSEETILFSDTVTFVPDSFLCIKERKISLEDIELLNIRINAEGDPNKDAFIAFGKFKILIGDKSIDEFPIRKTLVPEHQHNVEYIPINIKDKNIVKKIEGIRNKNIIAFGESIHGNNSIKELAYQLILQTVQEQECNLIIMEFPLEKSLTLNRYIQDKYSLIDSTLIPNRQMKIFLNKLRLYNSRKKDGEKVKILGMDYNYLYNANQNSAVDIFDFVTLLNSELKIPEIDKFAILLMDKDWDKAIDFLKLHNKEIQKLLIPDEIECIVHILTVSKKMGNDDIKRFIGRDSVMFVNSTFFIDNFSTVNHPKVIIYGHSSHINPISTFPAVPCNSFGMYMKETYSKDYFPFLFSIGSGKAFAYDATYNKEQLLLMNPPKESMEFFLNSFEDDIIYFPLTPYFNKLILSRFKGSHHIAQEFFPFNLYQRYCGIFFIKNAIIQNEEKELLFDEARDRFMLKNQKRSKSLSELQERIRNCPPYSD